MVILITFQGFKYRVCLLSQKNFTKQYFSTMISFPSTRHFSFFLLKFAHHIFLFFFLIYIFLSGR